MKPRFARRCLLLVLTLLTAEFLRERAWGQPGNPRPRPQDPFEKRAPPAGQGPGVVEWTCGACGKVIQRNLGGPSLPPQKCPHCGAAFDQIVDEYGRIKAHPHPDSSRSNSSEAPVHPIITLLVLVTAAVIGGLIWLGKVVFGKKRRKKPRRGRRRDEGYPV